MDERLIRAMLPADVTTNVGRDLAVERLVRELKLHVAAPNPMASFVFFNRTRRDIAMLPTRVYRSIADVICPYVYPVLFDFLYSLPPEMVADGRFHDDTIRRAFPELRDFPYAEKRPGRNDRAKQLGFAMELARHVALRGPSRLLRKSFIWPRLLRCLVDPVFLPSVSSFGPHVFFLAELGALLEGAGNPPDGLTGQGLA